jgi:hypothetical protein
VVDRQGIPLAVVHSAANVHDSKVLEEAVDAVASIRKPSRGRPRKRPAKLHAYTRLLRLPSMPRGFEGEGHNPPDSQAGHRIRREAWQIQVGGGTDTVVDEPLPAA